MTKCSNNLYGSGSFLMPMVHLFLIVIHVLTASLTFLMPRFPPLMHILLLLPPSITSLLFWLVPSIISPIAGHLRLLVRMAFLPFPAYAYYSIPTPSGLDLDLPRLSPKFWSDPSCYPTPPCDFPTRCPPVPTRGGVVWGGDSVFERTFGRR